MRIRRALLRLWKVIESIVEIACDLVDLIVAPLQRAVGFPTAHLLAQAHPVNSKLSIAPMDLFGVTRDAMRLVEQCTFVRVRFFLCVRCRSGRKR